MTIKVKSLKKVAPKLFKIDKSDPIKWAQPRVVNTTVIYKPTVHPREVDLKRFREAPSLVTGGVR
jgi:hypothetical protein